MGQWFPLQSRVLFRTTLGMLNDRKKTHVNGVKDWLYKIYNIPSECAYRPEVYRRTPLQVVVERFMSFEGRVLPRPALP